MSPSAKKRARIKFYLGSFISLACLFWVFWYIEKAEFLTTLKNANLFFIIIAILFTFLSYLLRSLRWPFFFKINPPTFSSSFRCLIVGFFMNNILPARIGELVRAHIGGRATNQSRALVLATVAGERLADGVTISLMFVITFTFGATANELQSGAEIYFVCYLFAFAAICTVLILLLRERVFFILRWLSKIIPGHIPAYSFGKIQLFIEGLEPMLRLKSFIQISIFSVVIWSIELIVYYEVSLAFHQPMSIGALSLFLAVVNFSSLLPAAPAGIGVIEAIATFSLERIGVNRETALAMVATQHVIQFMVVGLPGAYYFYLTMGGRIPSSEREADLTKTRS